MYQGRWNVMKLHLERGGIPIARQFGIGICPWNVLSGGKFQTREPIEAREKRRASACGACLAGTSRSTSVGLARRWSMLLRRKPRLLPADGFDRSSHGRVIRARILNLSCKYSSVRTMASSRWPRLFQAMAGLCVTWMEAACVSPRTCRRDSIDLIYVHCHGPFSDSDLGFGSSH